jgi:transposase-like protein
MERVQVITGVERRRRHSEQEKAKILAETLEPGSSVLGVARRHGLSPSLLYCWRKTAQSSAFLPLVPSSNASCAVVGTSSLAAQAENETVKAWIGNDVILEFSDSIAPHRLAAIISAIRAR